MKDFRHKKPTMTRLILSILGLLLMGALTAQNKLLQKAMSKYADATGNSTGTMEFFADEDLSEPLDQVSDGDFVFYVKAGLNKNAAKLCDDYSTAALTMRFDNSRDIYDDAVETSKPLANIADDPGFVSYKIDLLDSEKGDLVDDYFTDLDENRVYPLTFTVYCPGKNKTVSEGEFAIDFSNGNEKFVAAFLSQQSDYSFTARDDFKDDQLKNEVIQFYQSIRDVEIVHFAWGERVPYRSDDGQLNIRRYSAAVTYVDGADNKCYKAGMSVYDEAPWPSTNYKFDGSSAALHNSTQVPCDRIGK